MKGSINRLISQFNFLHLAFFTLLLMSSYSSLAQSSLNSAKLDSLQSEYIEQVNINQADAETIAMILDGVGLKKAEAIVDYRETNGDFEAVDDLIMVSGIGELTLRNNVDKILLVSE